MLRYAVDIEAGTVIVDEVMIFSEEGHDMKGNRTRSGDFIWD